MHEHTALIEQVALYLGRPWKFNTLDQKSCWQRYIIDGQGRGLVISKEYNQPKAIAADIERRLLPRYLKAFEAAREHYLENRQRAELLNAVAHSFLKVSKGTVISHQSCDRQRTIRFENGTATLYGHSQEASMDLRYVTIDQAIQIAAFLNGDGVQLCTTDLTPETIQQNRTV